MKSEASLQERLIRKHKKEGWYVAHLSPPNHPGFPDLIAVKNCKIVMIEVKDFEKIGPREKMANVFQKSQPPFYLEQLGYGNRVFVFGYLKDNVVVFQINSVQMVTNLFAMGRDDFLLEYSYIFDFESQISN